MTEENVLQAEDFHFEAKADHRGNTYDSHWTMEEVERYHDRACLFRRGAQRGKDCEALGIAKNTLYQKLKALNLT